MAKLILTHEVTGLGTSGDIVTVKDGYARNYLLPRKLATPWSKGAEKQIESMRRARRAKAIASLEDAQAVRESLQSKTYTVSVKAGANGRLFGTVTSAHVAEAVTAAGGPALDRRAIEIPAHIKIVGEHAAQVRLHDDVVAKLKIKVVAD